MQHCVRGSTQPQATQVSSRDSRLLKHSEGGDWLYSEAMAVCPSRRDICIKCQARIEDPSNTANGLLFVAGDQRAFPRPLGCPQRSFGGKVREPWSTCRPDPTVGEPGRGEGKGFVRGLPGRQGRSWEQTQALCVLFHLLFCQRTVAARKNGLF